MRIMGKPMAGNLGLATGSRRDAFTCLQVLPDSPVFDLIL